MWEEDRRKMLAAARLPVSSADTALWCARALHTETDPGPWIEEGMTLAKRALAQPPQPSPFQPY